MDKTNTPLVSIVVITYNSVSYILETLESVKDQTWENIELIISDDGSTDQTIEVCSEWLHKNRGRFHHTQLITVAQNTGIPANCNRGLRATRGEWLKTISGDDVLLSSCISDNMEYVRENKDAYFIVSDVHEIDEKGELIRDQVDNEGLQFIAKITSARKQLKAYTRWPAFLNTPTFFSRRIVLEKVGYCDENFMIYEDMTMVIRIMENDFKLYYMNQPTVAYRVHRNAVSRNTRINNQREKEAFRVFLKYRKRYLNIFNPLDLSIYYECWLRFKYKGFFGRRGDFILRKLSLYYWYMKLNGVKTY